MFHRILVPTDFSESSERALRLAVKLAAESSAHLTVLHCAGVPSVFDSRMAGVVYYDELLERMTRELDAHLERVVRAQVPESVSHDRIRVTGFPPVEIVTHATTGGYDLIVMGTHGRTGLNHVVMGSVAARVIQRSEIPVLVCR